jgi:hypothetical protein
MGRLKKRLLTGLSVLALVIVLGAPAITADPGHPPVGFGDPGHPPVGVSDPGHPPVG